MTSHCGLPPPPHLSHCVTHWLTPSPLTAWRHLWMVPKRNNKFILLQKFESFFSQFILFSDCTFWILSCSKRYSKCILVEIIRRVLKTFPKTYKSTAAQGSCKKSTFPGTLDSGKMLYIFLHSTGTSSSASDSTTRASERNTDWRITHYHRVI